MVNKFYSRVEMPLIRKPFTAKYSSTDKPTGLEYLILTMVESGSMVGYDLAGMMKKTGIPESLFDMFCEVLRSMTGPDKIMDCRTTIDLDTPVSEFVLTELGHQAYEMNVIARDIKNLSNCVNYRPAQMSNKFILEGTVNESYLPDTGRYESLRTDEDDLRKFIETQKKNLEVPEEESIFDIQFEEGETMLYTGDIPLTLNENTGNLEIVNDSNVDQLFLKSNMNAKEIIEAIPDDALNLTMEELTVNKWSDDPILPGNSFLNPRDFFFLQKDLNICDGETCMLEDNYPGFTAGYSIVSISSNNSGYGYKFVRKDVNLSGFDGSKNMKLMTRCKLDKDTIRQIIRTRAESMLNGTDLGLTQYLGLMKMSDDRSSVSGKVSEYLLSSRNLENSLRTLVKKHNEFEFLDLNETLTETLVQMDAGSVIEFAEIISELKIKPDVETIATKHKSNDRNLNQELTDCLLCLDEKRSRSLMEILETAQDMVDLIFESDEKQWKSRYTLNLVKGQHKLAILKNAMNMKSLTDYSFNMETLEIERRDAIVHSAPEFLSSAKVILEDTNSSERHQELLRYTRFFEDIYSAVKDYNDQNLETMNDRLFGIRAGIRLHDALAIYDDSEEFANRIRGAFSKKCINQEDFDVMNELREFRNKCAHEEFIPKLDTRQRRTIIKLIEKLESSKPKSNKSKKSKKEKN